MNSTRGKTQEVDYVRGLVIGNHLIDVLQKQGHAQSLSAPEIGENSSVFVTYIQNTSKIYINPRIIKKFKEVNKIIIEYTDEYGNFNIQEINGSLAIILQHQCDHLEGVVMDTK